MKLRDVTYSRRDFILTAANKAVGAHPVRRSCGDSFCSRTRFGASGAAGRKACDALASIAALSASLGRRGGGAR
jgi:hypothetical protein